MAFTVDNVVDQITEKMEKLSLTSKASSTVTVPAKLTHLSFKTSWLMLMAQKCASKKLQAFHPDARTIAIQPYDATILPEIEKAPIMANIGITPMNDGQLTAPYS